MLHPTNSFGSGQTTVGRVNRRTTEPCWTRSFAYGTRREDAALYIRPERVHVLLSTYPMIFHSLVPGIPTAERSRREANLFVRPASLVTLFMMSFLAYK